MSKQLFYKQLKEQEKELTEALLAVRALIKHYESDSDSPQDSTGLTRTKFPASGIDDSKYDKNWIIPDKVLFCLKEIKTGFVSDVADVLVSKDSSFSKDKAKKACTHHLSLLYKNNKIGATDLGKKYKYFIKDVEEIPSYIKQ